MVVGRKGTHCHLLVFTPLSSIVVTADAGQEDAPTMQRRWIAASAGQPIGGNRSLGVILPLLLSSSKHRAELPELCHGSTFLRCTSMSFTHQRYCSRCVEIWVKAGRAVSCMLKHLKGALLPPVRHRLPPFSSSPFFRCENKGTYSSTASSSELFKGAGRGCRGGQPESHCFPGGSLRSPAGCGSRLRTWLVSHNMFHLLWRCTVLH